MYVTFFFSFFSCKYYRIVIFFFFFTNFFRINENFYSIEVPRRTNRKVLLLYKKRSQMIIRAKTRHSVFQKEVYLNLLILHKYESTTFLETDSCYCFSSCIIFNALFFSYKTNVVQIFWRIYHFPLPMPSKLEKKNK